MLKFKSIIKNIYRSVLVLALGTNIAFALDVNMATQAELDSLKGIGPVKAKAIIDERSKHGSFKDSNDLSKRVKGLGEKSVLNLQKNGLTIGSTTNNYTVITPSSTAKDIKKPSATGIGTEQNNTKSVLNHTASKPIIINKNTKLETEKNQHLKAKIESSASTSSHDTTKNHNTSSVASSSTMSIKK